MFANVQEYDTVAASEKQLEAHRGYYDVQFVVSGQELLQYAQLDGLPECQPFDEGNDFGLYETPEQCTNVVLRAGDLAVLAPKMRTSPAARSASSPAMCARSS